MRIAIILGVLSLGVVIAAALYMLVTRRRAVCTPVSGKNEVPTSETKPIVQPEPSAQTKGLDIVQDQEGSHAIEAEIKTAVGSETPPVQQETQPTLTQAQPGLSQLGAEDASEAAAVITATVTPQEKGSHPEVASIQEGEPPPTWDSMGEKGTQAPVSDTSDVCASVMEQIQTGVDEDLHGEEIEPSPKVRHVRPENSGGRSRTGEQGQDGERKETVRSGRRSLKPEVVCWKREREWFLGVEVPAELQQRAEISVLQNGMRLAEDEMEKDCWQLAKLDGQVVIRILNSEREREVKSELGDDNYLVFKLSGKDLNQGRRVKRLSVGQYLAVVPDDWDRSGMAPTAPEPVCLEGYRAHFFDLVGDPAPKIVLRDSTGRLHEIGSSGPRFELVGQEVHDASENIGPLFGGPPPRIRVHDGIWQEIGVIVLGEEGRGRGRWRKPFRPNPAQTEQEMPKDIATRKAGWYFMRFYNLQEELIDSLDFRFVAGLRELAINQSNPFPAATGHGNMTVNFQHDADCCVERLPMSSGEVKIEHASERTILTIPPVPVCDRTRWLVGPRGGPQVEVGILVERIWWAAGYVSEPPLDWQDACLSLCPEDFTATSERAVWLRFPKPRWTDRVFVGFQQTKWRELAPKVAESTIAVPLRDFSDSLELSDRTIDHFLRVWMKVNNVFHEAALAIIAADMVEGALDLVHISACHLARVLTTLKGATRGPMRQLLKGVRRQYRRARRSVTGRNVDFVKDALCTIAVFLQETESRHSAVPKLATRWKSKARLASREFPETTRQVWRRYRELGK